MYKECIKFNTKKHNSNKKWTDLNRHFFPKTYPWPKGI